MAPQVKGQHVVVTPQQPDQLLQIGLGGCQPGAENQRSSLASPGHGNGDTVVKDGELIGIRGHTEHARRLTLRQGQPAYAKSIRA